MLTICFTSGFNERPCVKQREEKEIFDFALLRLFLLLSLIPPQFNPLLPGGKKRRAFYKEKDPGVAPILSNPRTFLSKLSGGSSLYWRPFPTSNAPDVP